MDQNSVKYKVNRVFSIYVCLKCILLNKTEIEIDFIQKLILIN